MYIEPCCCDRQLPALLKGGGVAFFQTNGDVTVQKMMAAVSSLAGDEHRLTLCVPEADVLLLRELKRYFDRGWTRELHLLTCQPQEDEVMAELAPYADCVTYAADPMVIDGLLAFEPLNIEHEPLNMGATAQNNGQSSMVNGQCVIIQGAMLAKVDFSFSLYTAYYGSNQDIIDEVLQPVRSKLKLRNRKSHTDTTDSTDK